MEGMRFKKEGPEGELILEAGLTIENAAGLRSMVQEALLKTDSLEIVIGKEAGIDITLLQILCSAHRTAVKAGKRLSVRGGESSLVRVLSDAGLRGCNCGAGDRYRSCLWAEGGSDE